MSTYSKATITSEGGTNAAAHPPAQQTSCNFHSLSRCDAVPHALPQPKELGLCAHEAACRISNCRMRLCPRGYIATDPAPATITTTNPFIRANSRRFYGHMERA